MRKTKEDAELTKQHLLEASFRLFYEYGFDRTSLEQICQLANVTRGAAYWHFKNKQEIYEQTIREVLHQIHVVVENQIQANTAMTPQEALVEMLLLPQQMPENFEFIRRTIVYLSTHEDFADLREEIHQAKMRQYAYFLESISKAVEANERLAYISPEEIAFLLFSFFDGIYNGDIPKTMPVQVNKPVIENCVHLLLDK